MFKSLLVRRLIRLCLCLLLLGGSLLAYVSHQGVQALLYPHRAQLDDYHRKVLAKSTDYGFKLTEFQVARPDGVTLAANYLEAMPGPLPAVQAEYQRKLSSSGLGEMLRWEKSRGLLVLLHGRNSCKEHWYPAAERFARIGYNILLIDNRAHGQSDGGCCTFGGKEATDVSAVLDEVAKRWGTAGSGWCHWILARWSNRHFSVTPGTSHQVCGVGKCVLLTWRKSLPRLQQQGSGALPVWPCPSCNWKRNAGRALI